MYENGYTPPILTVDSVIFQIIEDVLQVLLIQRAKEPFKNAWALPGGYVSRGETTHDAMYRILAAKAGVKSTDLSLVEQLYTFDTVARDPRGHAVSVTYMGLSKSIDPVQSSATQNPQFFPVKQLPENMAYDHVDIIKYTLERLQSKIGYTNAAFALLPHMFTLTQLQSVYEAVIGEPLDKRNFRKKILNQPLLTETDRMHREGAHRPARLYSFSSQSLQSLPRSFD